MRVLLWNVHTAYTDAFVRGDHDYLIPVDEARDAWGLGVAGRPWVRAREVELGSLREEEIDVVVLQRPEELQLVERLTGRRVGRELPAVYLEHHAPPPDSIRSRHPLSDQDAIPVVHITHFNDLFWDSGRARTLVVEHGLPDPGDHYTGGLAHFGAVVNEPARRGRVTGTDLLPSFARIAPVDVFGSGGVELEETYPPEETGIVAAGDLSPELLRRELGERRVYLHPHRWTSLGLALIEAMMIGMPVVAVAATEAPRAVPHGAGVVSTDLDELLRASIAYIVDPGLAFEAGQRARHHALHRFSHATFLRGWDAVLGDVVASGARGRPVGVGAR
ncbi:glycosyltransferase [Microbacterium sp. B2969]|uniref:Glycosyltransferase n=1 Tax=Microbacterium alkaliflavum TaxID=3248839 RepID=A0ABW7QC75_9MICO